MSDLAERVHAGVGAPGAGDERLFLAEPRDRLLQRLLDRGAVALPLPAGKVGPVVFDRQFVARIASERQHDLADMVRVLDAPVGGGGFSEREGRIDQRAATARGDERPDARFQGVDDFRLLGDRARTQRRAGVGETLGHDRLQVDLDFAPVEKGDLDDAAVERRNGVVAGDVVAADHVEDDVGALAAVAASVATTKSSSL